MKTNDIDFINDNLLVNEYDIKLTNWELDIANKLIDNPKIKKIWIVHNRKIGATTFCKILHWLKVNSPITYVVSNNLRCSKHIARDICFRIKNPINKESSGILGREWAQPITTNKLKKELFGESYTNFNIYHLMYDGIFKPKKYEIINSVDWSFFTISVNVRDYDKIKPYLDKDKNRDDVLILVADNIPMIKI